MGWATFPLTVLALAAVVHGAWLVLREWNRDAYLEGLADGRHVDREPRRDVELSDGRRVVPIRPDQPYRGGEAG